MNRILKKESILIWQAIAWRLRLWQFLICTGSRHPQLVFLIPMQRTEIHWKMTSHALMSLSISFKNFYTQLCRQEGQKKWWCHVKITTGNVGMRKRFHSARTLINSGEYSNYAYFLNHQTNLIIINLHNAVQCPQPDQCPHTTPPPSVPNPSSHREQRPVGAFLKDHREEKSDLRPLPISVLRGEARGVWNGGE